MPVLTRGIYILEVAVCLVAMGCCLTSAIAISITQNQAGWCVLSASVGKLPGGKVNVTPIPVRCDFCIIFDLAGALLALVFVVYRIIVLRRHKWDIEMLGRVFVMVIFAVLGIFLFVASCLVSAGLSTFCGNLLSAVGDLSTCADFLLTNPEGNPISFYNPLKAAEAASWISVLLWLTLVAISLVIFCLARRLNWARRLTTASPPETVVT